MGRCSLFKIGYLWGVALKGGSVREGCLTEVDFQGCLSSGGCL